MLRTFALKRSVSTKSTSFDIFVVLFATTNLCLTDLNKSEEKFGINHVNIIIPYLWPPRSSSVIWSPLLLFLKPPRPPRPRSPPLPRNPPNNYISSELMCFGVPYCWLCNAVFFLNFLNCSNLDLLHDRRVLEIRDLDLHGHHDRHHCHHRDLLASCPGLTFDYPSWCCVSEIESKSKWPVKFWV